MSDEVIKPKDPQADLDYGFDWATKGWLINGDTIVTSTWAITGPDLSLTKHDPTHDTTTTTIWLTGGTINEGYGVTNHIITAQGREDDRTIRIVIRQR